MKLVRCDICIENLCAPHLSKQLIITYGEKKGKTMYSDSFEWDLDVCPRCQKLIINTLNKEGEIATNAIVSERTFLHDFESFKALYDRFVYNCGFKGSI